MAKLDQYSDAELRAVLAERARARGSAGAEQTDSVYKFCNWLDGVGLDGFANDIRKIAGAWERMKKIWGSIFG